MASYAVHSTDSAKETNDLRRLVVFEAIKVAAGTGEKSRLGNAWLALSMCGSSDAPPEDFSASVRSRLRGFYPVYFSELDSDGCISITYRHKSLASPDRPRVKPPSTAGLTPAGIELDDISGGSGLVDITEPASFWGVSDGPFELTIRWMAIHQPAPPEAK